MDDISFGARICLFPGCAGTECDSMENLSGANYEKSASAAFLVFFF